MGYFTKQLKKYLEDATPYMLKKDYEDIWAVTNMSVHDEESKYNEIEEMEIIPFDLLKELRDKGFIMDLKYAIGYYDDLGHFLNAADYYFLDSWMIAPTIFQVINWLKKEKKIYLCVNCYPSFSTIEKVIWSYIIKYNSSGDFMEEKDSLLTYTKSREAYIEGIKYIIHNII